MADVLTAKITARIAGRFTSDGGIADDAEYNFSHDASEEFEDGTGAGKADKVFDKEADIAASGNAQIDLAGALVDVYGESVSAAKIKGFLLAETSGETDTVLHVGGGTDGAGAAALDTWLTSAAADGSEKLIVDVGGMFAVSAPTNGYVVTAGSADVLRIENQSGTKTAHYKLTVLFEGA